MSSTPDDGPPARDPDYYRKGGVRLLGPLCCASSSSVSDRDAARPFLGLGRSQSRLLVGDLCCVEGGLGDLCR